MYEHLDELLAKEKEKVRSAFNHLDVTGFDELNVVRVRENTKEMFDRFLAENEALYLRAAKKAYSSAVKTARKEGYDGEETEINVSWVAGALAGYSLVTGYLYKREAERKRLRLNEQILTAREFNDRQMYHDSLRKSANLWWTQTMQYGVSTVDKATIEAFKDMGVRRVKWVSIGDGRACTDCAGRNNKIYELSKIPEKTHYGCRCYIVPVETKEK